MDEIQTMVNEGMSVLYMNGGNVVEKEKKKKKRKRQEKKGDRYRRNKIGSAANFTQVVIINALHISTSASVHSFPFSMTAPFFSPEDKEP